MFGGDGPSRSAKVLAGVALAASLALTGCSGDSDDDSAEEEQSSSVFGVPSEAGQDDEPGEAGESEEESDEESVVPETTATSPGETPDSTESRVCEMVSKEQVQEALGTEFAMETTGTGRTTTDAYTRNSVRCTRMNSSTFMVAVELSAKDDYSHGTFVCEEWSHTGTATAPTPVAELGVPASWAFFSDAETDGKLRMCVDENLVEVTLDLGGLTTGDDLKDDAVAVAELYVAALRS